MDYEEKKQKIEIIVNSEMKKIRTNELKAIVERIERNHPKSNEIYKKMKEIIPGGVEHNLAFNFPFPLASKRVYDCFMETVDDVKLTDFLMCGGPIILGHNYKPFIEKMIDVIQNVGPCHGITNEYELMAAEALQRHFPSCEMVRWYQSGTESAMAAIRVARTFTKKKWIVKIGGSYHGWSDQLVYDLHIPGTKTLESHGIPPSTFKWIESVKPNDIEELKAIFKEKRKIAAVIMEPMGGESGANPVRPEFNKEVEELCHENGTLLIFDEVVCAFRLSDGGGQKYYGVKPDISVFGKIVGHGFPSAGAIGGRKDVVSVLAGGVAGGDKKAYTGGTIAANPLTCAAAYNAIKLIEETNAVEKATKCANRLSGGLNKVFQSHDLPWFSYNEGAAIHMHTSCVFGLDLKNPTHIGQINERKEFMGHLGAALVDQEIISVAGSRFYTCLQHSDEIIDSTIEKIDKICKLVE
ncbi:MAG: aminotransferase class III-fold pyridoxal phosphate-dependent enzyme [Candidatus Lokiarchaeota archaeon]|nr:aminotransferase class III-fold pyridoxal phosphate-dependent enzyme [Candidatus Lokiarchaeota archaeon]